MLPISMGLDFAASWHSAFLGSLIASQLKGKIPVALNPAAAFDGVMAWNHAWQKSSEKQYFVSLL